MSYSSRLIVGVFSALLLLSSLAEATGYPSRPVRFVALNPPGGVSDIVARTLGEQLAARWGQPFVVDNRVGAGGIIGSVIVAKAPADGHTLLLGFIGNLSINPSLYKKLPYNPEKDFAPISLAARSPMVVIANNGFPVTSIKGLIDLAKSKPGQIHFASSGVGNGNHLAAELFASMAGITLVHVPYKGGPPALLGVVQNEASFMFANAAFAVPQVKAGHVKALAVTSKERLLALPEVPTMAESGVPGYEVTTWFGVLAPAGTPRAVVNKLNKAITQALHEKTILEKFERLSLIASPSTPSEFATLIKSETQRWRKVILETGTRAN